VHPGQVPIPALPAGQKPNFIIILTDDQGWDDIGLHNPDYVNTPNLDKFIKGGTFFTNFYVTPQCAQTRAALLTGRQYPKTGTMLVHAGRTVAALAVWQRLQQHKHHSQQRQPQQHSRSSIATAASVRTATRMTHVGVLAAQCRSMMP
jgi:arylsulfatase A-like enzyme